MNSDYSPQIMSSFISVAALMSLFVFVYTVIGLHAFGTEDQVNESGEIVDFSTFLGSLTVVFQVLTVRQQAKVAAPLLCFRSNPTLQDHRMCYASEFCTGFGVNLNLT